MIAREHLLLHDSEHLCQLISDFTSKHMYRMSLCFAHGNIIFPL